MILNIIARFGETQIRKFKIELSKTKIRLFLLCLLFLGLFRRRVHSPTSIIFTLSPEQVYYGSSPKEVLRVFREEQFASRANFENPLIEVRSMRTLIFPNANFTFDVPIYVLHRILQRRNYLDFFSFMNNEIRNPNNSSNLRLRNFKELLFNPHIYWLLLSDPDRPIDLITTQSSLKRLPSAFKIAGRQKKIMVWYSTNSKQIFDSEDKNRNGIEIEEFKDYVNEHWVWNEYEVKFLQSSGVRNVIPVGPVVFQYPKSAQKKSKTYVITYFDVTPFQNFGGFYSENNTTSVLNLIIRLSEVLNEKYPGQVLLLLKPKRKYRKSHSISYVSLVKKSVRNQKIGFIPPSANLYESIWSSDLVLAIPFTSPAVLAKELNVRSFFIWTGIGNWDIAATSDGVPVISSFEELLKEIDEGIRSKFAE
jgi:polysaccharide biosynthesis PFTS motif protein